MPAFKDLTGKTFGRLTVSSERRKLKHHYEWLANCECGQSKWILGYDMTQGKTKSCGCYNSEVGKASTKHGCSRRGERTKEYRIWKNIGSRCHNPNTPGWENYGGRGIMLCERWQAFSAFLEDMGECPDGMSIDRINNDGNYEPGNCRWATRKEQNRNRRNNKMIEYNGESKTVAEWCEILGLPYSRTNQRLLAGYTIDNAFAVPKRT